MLFAVCLFVFLVIFSFKPHFSEIFVKTYFHFEVWFVSILCSYYLAIFCLTWSNIAFLHWKWNKKINNEKNTEDWFNNRVYGNNDYQQ